MAIARSLADQTFVRCTLVELHSAKVGTQHDPRMPLPAHSSRCNTQTMRMYSAGQGCVCEDRSTVLALLAAVAKPCNGRVAA